MQKLYTLESVSSLRVNLFITKSGGIYWKETVHKTEETELLVSEKQARG